MVAEKASPAAGAARRPSSSQQLASNPATRLQRHDVCQRVVGVRLHLGQSPLQRQQAPARRRWWKGGPRCRPGMRHPPSLPSCPAVPPTRPLTPNQPAQPTNPPTHPCMSLRSGGMATTLCCMASSMSAGQWGGGGRGAVVGSGRPVRGLGCCCRNACLHPLPSHHNLPKHSLNRREHICAVFGSAAASRPANVPSSSRQRASTSSSTR